MIDTKPHVEAIDAADWIDIRVAGDIVTARQAGRSLAQTHEFNRSQLTRFATAISELTRNVLTYASTGKCGFRVFRRVNKLLVCAVIVDYGPGIDDIEIAMQDGYSGGSGLGLGLPGARRLVDEFLIESRPGLTRIDVSICRPA